MATAEETIQFLEQRSRAYRLCFSTPAGKEVLADLIKFCRANESGWDDDAHKRNVLLGRREVWLRITEHFALEIDDLVTRYRPIMVLKPAED